MKEQKDRKKRRQHQKKTKLRRECLVSGSTEVPKRQQKELIRKLRIRTILAFRQSMITFSNVV